MFWTWVKNQICAEVSKDLKDREAYIKDQEESIKTLQQSIIDKDNQIAVLVSDNEKLEKENAGIIPNDIKKLADEMKASYPSAVIYYKGYTIKLKNSTQKPNVKVQDFIQVLESHRQWVSSKGLTLQNYLLTHPQLEFGEVVNKLMFDIYKAYAPTKTYMYDSDLYGVDEQWAPLIDTWYLKKMDCENSTNELMALFEAAGLTGDLKSFYWNVCGRCSLGGHSTLYCYDFKDKTWRHIETTETRVLYSNFHKLPDNKDTNDKLNITSVWWSFNSDIARHVFKTDADKKAYNKRDRFKNIIIK